ncbi:prolipoprotein diacylglyceryl transferase family protein [Lignipirellula cremea]|uniref:Phosphatidylglycerol--prolipoprotein diacylglyceryl transferase n=1 Tax=Lignipirellula cremea TaxID=2528010 RepID=A0A518DT15_9BACT|nr:prolipoprotein diacylglyceryl transferase family protein [Lignipirellula cremea]QDU94980.1 Prolipoprotein diacylglyceryl transferase [Lignipirellula cremea]
MRQTLFYIPDQLYGMPVYGMGLLLALWAIAGVLFFLLHLKSQQGKWTGDTTGHFVMWLFIGLAIWKLLPELVVHDPTGSGLPIRGYGVMLLCGVVTSVLLAAYRARRMGLDPEVIFSLSFAMFIAGIIGARVFYVIQYHDKFDSLMSVLSVTNGGLVVYGSVIGGLGAGIIFVVRRGLSPLAIGDIIAPSMVLGLAFGRIGCLFNGCCFGGVCESNWAPRMEFPGPTSSVTSPPYQYQRAYGQLHGFRLGKDEQNRPTIAHLLPESVFPDNPALAADLAVGDRITRINLSPLEAVRAAPYIDWPEGAQLELTTLDGQTFHTPLERTGKEVPRYSPGFELTFDGEGELVTQRVKPDSPAAKAGLENGMQLESLSLPPIESFEIATQLLDFSNRILLVETADGKRANLSVHELRDPSLPVHPTQIYASINAFLLCAFLWCLYPYRRRDGVVFATLLVTYPIARILLEAIRTDVDTLGWVPLTISQFISVCILLLGAALWVFLSTRPDGTSLPVDRSLPDNTPLPAGS